MGTEVAIAGLIVSALATGASMQQQRKAAKEQKKANKIQTNRELAADAENIRQQVREERIRKAQILQGAENSGTSGSSGTTTAVGALQTETGGNIANIRSDQRAAMSVANRMQSAADAKARANTFASVADLAMTGANAANSFFSPEPQAKVPGTQPPIPISETR